MADLMVDYFGENVHEEIANALIKEKNEINADFPKLHSPFIRRVFSINNDGFKKYRKELNLRKPEVYIVMNEINSGYEWVFNDPDTFAVEKLDGSNTKIITDNFVLLHLYNRKNKIDPLLLQGKGNLYYLEGVINASKKGYIKKDGMQFGELIGPKFQGNPYKLTEHIWFPFHKAIKSLRYKSFDKYDRNMANWSSWFQYHIFSLYASRFHKIDMFPEGIILYNLRRKKEGKVYMAKLRRDMFHWYYDKKVEIIGYLKDY